MHLPTAFPASAAALLPHHPLRPPPLLRPARASDAPLFCRYVEGLCVSAQRMRFHGVVRGCTPGLQAVLCGTDGSRQVAYVATLIDDGGERLVGEARYVPDADGSAAEFAISVADAWCGTGVAERLMHKLIADAADRGIGWLYGEVLETNGRMLAFMQRLGFALSDGGVACGHGGVPSCGVLRVERALHPARPARSAPDGGRAGGAAQRWRQAEGWLQRWLQSHRRGAGAGPRAC
ncbi:GNAT family N-acetyltransferase [Aquincola sp. J276]|uniref:GNAT family N-acetyltransferase n=1 Tax=Aquincola sp. J276 TaxID=2898432 RepID=UPI0021518C2C|nr:GNAT family N-acetyltransferase [Aquincola sp. J276]MCR5867451.1 GNAT family N-acetyltransferase [Aquincola sp. J276]